MFNLFKKKISVEELGEMMPISFNDQLPYALTPVINILEKYKGEDCKQNKMLIHRVELITLLIVCRLQREIMELSTFEISKFEQSLITFLDAFRHGTEQKLGEKVGFQIGTISTEINKLFDEKYLSRAKMKAILERTDTCGEMLHFTLTKLSVENPKIIFDGERFKNERDNYSYALDRCLRYFIEVWKDYKLV